MNRRTFVQNSSLALGALSLRSPTVYAYSEKKLGVCLVGLGSYSERLARALEVTDHCYLAGIVTGSPAKVPIWQRKYDIPDVNVYDYSNLHLVANNSDIDVVYIVVPTGLHSLYARVAANAGKHVWCEKPMAMTVTECEAIMETCQKNNVKLSIGYRMHHEPNTQQLIRWSGTAKYGEVRSLSASIGYDMVPDPAHWRMSSILGGGYLFDLGVYSVNAIRYAAQEEPTSVFARHTTVRKELFTDIPEVTEFTLYFDSGLEAKGRSSARENVHELDFYGSEGWMKLDPFSKYDGIAGTTSDGHVFKDQISNQQAVQMDNDALAILNDERVLVPGAEGLRDIRILEAINESARTNQEVKV